MTAEKTRISILDGFRSIAILIVILYHFFSRWTPPNSQRSLYPYDDQFNYFSYGHLGVQFFFIISGFVIFFTLEKTDKFISFWKKRVIRLLPSMVAASILTFLIVYFFDINNLFPDSRSLTNLVFSLTFINPDLFNVIFNSDVSYVNGSYWSLWPEIQFYAFSSLLYFVKKEKFLWNFLLVSFILFFLNYFIQHTQGTNTFNIDVPHNFILWYRQWVTNGFNLIQYLHLFCLGILFYELYKNKKREKTSPLCIQISLLFLILFTIYSGIRLPIRIIYAMMIIAFIMFIYYPNNLKFLENSTITSIGKSSYFLYLIHENIGVLLIFSFGSAIMPLSILLPIIIIVSLILLSILFSNKIDKPINRWFKRYT
ncbi:acyltransferase family protein [Gelidibacter salicanalis]|nr:acyltransferase [Gelidibacter salicanalis]